MNKLAMIYSCLKEAEYFNSSLIYGSSVLNNHEPAFKTFSADADIISLRDKPISSASGFVSLLEKITEVLH